MLISEEIEQTHEMLPRVENETLKNDKKTEVHAVFISTSNSESRVAGAS